MSLSFSSLAVMLATYVATGPGDPVGITDARDESEPAMREVWLDGAHWQQLRELAESEPPVEKPPGPWASDRRVEIEALRDGLRIRATWTVQAREAGWWAGPLIGPLTGMRVESLRWRGRELGITHTSAGEEVALEMAANTRGELTLVVFVPADQLPGGIEGGIDVSLMPAVRGELRLRGMQQASTERVPELSVTRSDGASEARRMIDDRFWTGEAQLGLRWVEAKANADASEGPLAVAQTAMGLTFGDGEVRGRARVSWLLRRGQLDRVSIDTAGLGRDLELAGPNVRAWTRSGDRIDVELEQPADGRIDIDMRWSEGLPSGAEARLPAPRISAQQVYRSESFLQIARDGELEILPQLEGWSPLASTELPDWAGGFIQGTATASFHSESAGQDRGASFELLRFEPLSGPPVMVDVAAYEIATTDEGRNLVHARYDVRNERASHLRVDLPAGARLLGVRVNGEAATPSRDGSSWRVPLIRSLESVKGSLSFPVEVIFISEDGEWLERASRELELPALDAPVAVSRVHVYLPPNYENSVAVGQHHRVADFSEGEGITYGLGVGVSSAEVNRADELYREALSGWMANDFERAQSSLDELEQLGASNANISGLQANLDLVQGRSESDGKDGQVGGDGDASGAGGGQSAVVSRRIKDQAKIRAVEDKLELIEKTKEAEEYEAQGDYDKAEQTLEEAKQLGDRLALLEQSESQEQAVYNQALSSSSARVADKKKRKAERERDVSTKRKTKSVIVYEFGDDEIQGEVLMPEGSSAFGTPIATSPDDGYANVDAPALTPPPEPEPIVQYEAAPPEEMPVITEDMLEALPTGTTTSRDFTAVVDMAPGSTAPRVSLAGTTGGYIEDENPLADSRPRRQEARASRGGKGKYKSGKRDAASPQQAWDESQTQEAPMAPPMVADPNAALAGPVATASAVTIHVPAIGEAVLYQHMLLPEGKALTVHLSARRHKTRNRKTKP